MPIHSTPHHAGPHHSPSSRAAVLALVAAMGIAITCPPASASPPSPGSTPACQLSRLVVQAHVGGIHGDSTPAADLDRFIAAQLARSGVPGVSVAVINQGRLAYSRAAGIADRGTGAPVTDCTIFEGASITKPLFGNLVMTFVAEGRLDLDRPLHEYLAHPDLALDPRHRLITARMVLSHQTGLPNWRSDEPEGRLQFRFEPGTGFSYSGEAYQYLAKVLQQIAGVDGQGLEELFQQRIARPAGMQRTQIIPGPDLLMHKAAPHLADGSPGKRWAYDGTFGAAYGVNSNAPDLARWVVALMQQNADPASLPSGLRAAYLEPQPVVVPYDPKDDPLGVGPGEISLGFFVNNLPVVGRLYSHDGNNPGFSSLVLMHPQNGWGFVAFANGDQSTRLLLEIAMFLNPSLRKRDP